MRELPDAALLHLDADLAIVDKPPGLPSHGTVDPQRDHLVAAATRLLRRLDHGGELHIAHRLDRDTSGIVVFARHAAAAAALGAALAAHEAVDKRYLAVCRLERAVPDRWDHTDHLRARKDGVVVAVRSGGQRASSRFRVWDRRGGFALVEARPLTGRRHQLRVHLSDAGAPIVGDDTYGEPALGAGLAPRLLLHAFRITLPHPSTGEPLHVQQMPPQDYRAAAARLDLFVD